jgi:hypothetical protein
MLLLGVRHGRHKDGVVTRLLLDVVRHKRSGGDGESIIPLQTKNKRAKTGARA